MADFFEKNRIPAAIIIAGLIIAVAIWMTSRSSIDSFPSPKQNRQFKPAESLQTPSARITFSQAPDYLGKYVCVTGRVDHIYTSQKGTIFINFCPDYKSCPFGAVIFNSNVSKFPNPQQYTGSNVEITGFITAYQGRAEIVLESPAQIKIEQ